jgi:hypothetical protein
MPETENHVNLLTKKQKDEIVKKLGAARITRCPMCDNEAFTLVDGFIVHNVHRSANLSLGEGDENHVVPSVSLVCKNCGFMSMHSLAELRLMHLFNSEAGNG